MSDRTGRIRDSRLLPLIIGLLFGAPLGALATLAVMGSSLHTGSHAGPMRFADVTIWTTTKGASPELMMAKNQRPFLWASTNDVPEVNCVMLADSEQRIVLQVDRPSRSGHWTRAVYGSLEEPEKYIDIGFDGRFDVKMLLDANHDISGKYIHVDGDWRAVDRSEGQIVFSGPDSFIFRESGWQRRQAEQPGEAQRSYQADESSQ